MIRIFRKELIKYVALVVCVPVVVGFCACDAETTDGTKQSASAVVSPSITVGTNVDETETPNNDQNGGSENDGSSAAPSGEPDGGEGTATAVPSQTAPATSGSGTALPTQTPVVTDNPLYDEIAMSFFHGRWESTSGMIYIFNDKDLSITLKDKKNDEVLLVGTYVAKTQDFIEYDLSMTFNGVTDEYIAWKYADTGSVDLLTKDTMKSYDNIWRAQ